MNRLSLSLALSVCVFAGVAAPEGAARFDERMRVPAPVVTNGLKWIDGRALPIEGRAFNDTSHYYDRLPDCVTTNVNAGVRNMRHHTAGMQFLFRTDSRKLVFRWVPWGRNLAMDHMPATGMSGIDVYSRKPGGTWRYERTGRITDPRGGSLSLDWVPGTECRVHLPLYNGVKSFTLGIDPNATVTPLPPRANGVTRPVVFYGTSITHGGCASRPGLAWPTIVGRELDVPIVNLGFSGSGYMELEMSEHLARIDASCYVLDCLWNMGLEKDPKGRNNSVRANYENFIRNLRALRPGVPIVMAEQCDVFCRPPNGKDVFIRALYERLVKEGWKDLVYLPKTGMYPGDREGTVDGCHPNDLGMMSVARAFEGAVARALGLDLKR